MAQELPEDVSVAAWCGLARAAQGAQGSWGAASLARLLAQAPLDLDTKARAVETTVKRADESLPPNEAGNA